MGWTPFNRKRNGPPHGGHGGPPGDCRCCAGKGGTWLRQEWIVCALCKGWGAEPVPLPAWAARVPPRDE